jgi:DNA repair exonuclease SbcCD ATPase subunit
MAYTIRTTEEDENNLIELMRVMRVNSVSKALLKAAKTLPELIEALSDTKEQLKRKNNNLEAIKNAQHELSYAENRLKELLE